MKSRRPDSSAHQKYSELCALEAGGLLSKSESSYLHQHLMECAECSNLLAEYEQALVAFAPSFSEGTAAINEQNSPPVALPFPMSNVSGPSPEDAPTALRNLDWLLKIAALLIAFCIGAAAAYYFGQVRIRKMLEGIPSPSAANLSRPAATGVQSDASLPASASELDEMRTRLSHKSKELDDLRRSDDQLLHEANSNREAHEAEASSLQEQLSATQADLEVIKRQLSASQSQITDTSKNSDTLQHQVTSLQSELSDKETLVQRQQELLAHDHDIRDLMGARDLYISDVYDVAKNGDTQKPFGRVFYTKGKSLIFYAYDLDSQPGLQDVSTFQAWGSHSGTPRDAIRLGVFYQDNVSSRRWVMKSDDTKTLTDIDTVFVTVEPKNSGGRPQGKPFLYAYLHLSPNHP